MKQLMKSLLQALILSSFIFAVGYLFFSLVNDSFSPIDWSNWSKIVLSLVSFSLFVLSISIFMTINFTSKFIDKLDEND